MYKRCKNVITKLTLNNAYFVSNTQGVLPVIVHGGTGPGIILLAAEYSLGIPMSRPQRAHSVLFADSGIARLGNRSKQHPTGGVSV